MKVDVSRVDVWAAGIEDRPGGLAEKLDVLAQADVDLEFIIARRSSSTPGTAVVFVTPIKGPRQMRTARKVGWSGLRVTFPLRLRLLDNAPPANLAPSRQNISDLLCRTRHSLAAG